MTSVTASATSGERREVVPLVRDEVKEGLHAEAPEGPAGETGACD